MKVGAIGLVGVIFAGDGLAHAQQGPPKPDAIDRAQAPSVHGAVVHVEASDQSARVQELNESNEWITVCGVPCDRPLDPSFDYRVGGRGLRPTERFRVPPQGQLLLRANMKPTRNIALGATFASLGGLLLVSGFLEASVAIFERTDASSEQDATIAQHERDVSSLLNLVGAVSALTGVAMLIPGFIFLESGTKSTLETGAGSALRRSELRIIPGGFAF